MVLLKGALHMKYARKQARKWLAHALRGQFDEVLYQAKLTPRQLKIITMKFIEGLCNYQIAAALSVSPETIRDEVAQAYDRVAMAIRKFEWKNISNYF